MTAERRTTRHREAGEASRAETRRRLAAAAGELFLARGYAATTVTAIAESADVSLQTLYLAWGGKAPLLRAVLAQALSGTESGVDADYVPRLRAQITASAGDGGPAAVVRALAHVFVTMAERAAPWWRLYRDAAATEPEIARDWAALRTLRRETIARLLDPIPEQTFRQHREAIADTVWTIASPETYELLVSGAGYTPEAYETWLADTLTTVTLRGNTDDH